MNEKDAIDSGLPQASDLRREAEQRLRDKEAMPAQSMAEVDARALVHELQVHQIELEMQNEELLRAQVALQEVSDKYHDLFDFAPIGYFLWDAEGRILEINLAGAALLGLDRNAVIQKQFGQFVAMEHRPAFVDFCKRVLTTDTKQTCEVKLLKDGQSVYTLVEGIATQDHQGQEELCRGAVIDITERKRAEEELRAKQRQLEERNKELQETQRRLEAYRDRYVDLYDFAPLGYVTLDEDGYIQEINLAGAALLGRNRADLTGYPLAEYISEQDKQVFLTHLHDCCDGRREVTTELTLISEDGQPHFVQLRSLPVQSSDLEGTFCKTAIADMTPRKGTE
jgi:PAS domain S-box-containing protein